MEKPSTLTTEREAELREEAEGLLGSIGWNVPYTAENEEERAYFWYMVYAEYGYESCSTCGYYCVANEMYRGDLCDDCWENEMEEED